MCFEEAAVVIFKTNHGTASGFIQFSGLKSHRRLHWMEVSLADEVGLVSRLREFTCEGVRKIIRNRALTAAHAQDAGVGANLQGHQGSGAGEA